MLGLLMLAGLGFAATAIIDHLDQSSDDDPHPQEDEAGNAATSHASLLDDADMQDHSAITDHAALHHVASADHDHAASHHAAHHGGHHAAPHHPAHHDNHQSAPPHHAAPAGQSHAAAATSHVFGGDGNDTLPGTLHDDLIAGNGGDDRLLGYAGNDHLVGFDAGQDTLFGHRGDDTLHGFMVQKEPGDLSYVIEDHQSDHLHGGLGKDDLFLASDDVGTGGKGADTFHVSWDVEHGHPAQITDYNPQQDRIFVEFTSNHADAGMTDARPEEQTVTTRLMEGGSGTSILINGEEIAHVLGAHLRASDIGLIHN